MLWLFLLFTFMCFRGGSAELTKSQDSTYNAFLNKIDLKKSKREIEEVEQTYFELIDFCSSVGWSWGYYNSSISLAEYYRYSADFEKGLQLLRSLHGVDSFPGLQVRLLGRLAAIHNENYVLDVEDKIDSVSFYIDTAYRIAMRFQMLDQIPTLLRERGGLLIESNQAFEGEALLLQAADSFKLRGDSQNYAGSLVRALQSMLDRGDLQSVDSVSRYTWEYSKDKDWVGLKFSLAEIRSKVLKKAGDSLGYYKWQSRALLLFMQRQNETKYKNTEEYRILHERNEYRSSVENAELLAREKALALKEEEGRKQQLAVFLILSLISAILIGALYIKERRVKKQMRRVNEQLKKALSAYELVLVESNHRIKNNLQMIISLLRFSMEDKDDSVQSELESVSNKIHTISSLHQLLTMKDHKEKADLKKYCLEIINHYQNMGLLFKEPSVVIDDAQMNNERLVYFGLILNELLTNTVKYGAKAKKNIEVCLKRDGDYFSFSYQDFSIYSAEAKKGKGTELIQQLLRKINANNVIFNPEIGKYTFDFKLR